MQPASPRVVITRAVITLALASFSTHALADPQGPSTEQQLDVDPQRVQVEQLTIADTQRPQLGPLAQQQTRPSSPDEPPPRLEDLRTRQARSGQTTFISGVWGGGHDVAELTWRYHDPDVAVLDGQRVPTAALPRRARQIGVLYGVGYRPLPWLRLPEVRVGFGGGGYYTGAATYDTGDRGLGVAPTRTFLFRIEVLAGVEFDVGPFTPFLRGYAAGNVRTLRTRVSHRDLGALGTERITKLGGDLGVELGVAIHCRPDDQELGQSSRVGFTLAYRRGLLGADAHGLVLAFSMISG